MAARFSLHAYAFLGAALLFGLEPLVGRLLLPSFGGGFHVWATCLMVFQGSLLLGYLYCHLLARRLGRWHLVVAALPLTYLPIGRGLWQADPDPSRPILSILYLLGSSIVVPFSVIATSGVVAQQWLADSDLPQRDSPYRLFAASNGGALFGLLAYPLAIEPTFGLDSQRWLWSVLAVVHLAFAIAAFRRPRREVRAQSDEARARLMPRRTVGVWLLLSALPSACLLAVTNVLSLDLGSFPLLWMLPLGLYLLSFVLVFGAPSWQPRLLRLFWPELLVIGLLVWLAEAHVTWLSAILYLVMLFTACWIGHGELYARRPPPESLSRFYLAIGLGGWLGGSFVSLAAPLVFDSMAELPFSILGIVVTMAILRGRPLLPALRDRRIGWRLVVSGSLIALVGVGAVRRGVDRHRLAPDSLRDFYGVYSVTETTAADGDGARVPIRVLTHGSTIHGKELVDRRQQGRPIGFFHPASPLGEVFRVLSRPARVAVVGLGTGALAGHLGPGDDVIFYEIDPRVVDLARSRFHYLAATRASWHVAVGDARLRLREADDGGFDLVVIDAFSSDAIPTHLLTREALALYARKLRPDGLLAFHISNRYADLRPVLFATGRSLEPPLAGAIETTPSDRELAALEDPSEVYVLARRRETLAPLLGRGWHDAESIPLPALRPWTDDYASLLGAFVARALAR